MSEAMNGHNKAMEYLAKMDNLPDARLPQVYENAKLALKNCASVDECKDWANKAEALASYAKQAHDDELHKMAVRIQTRAIRRCGQLLEEIPKASGGDQSKKDSAILFGREKAANDAGLSEIQRKNALRVNHIPSEQFEELVESDAPPSVTKLAEMGKKKHPPKPLVDIGERTTEEFKAATGLIGLLEQILNQSKTIDIPLALRGCDERETRELIANIEQAIQWLKTLEKIARKICIASPTPIKP